MASTLNCADDKAMKLSMQDNHKSFLIRDLLGDVLNSTRNQGTFLFYTNFCNLCFIYGLKPLLVVFKVLLCLITST